MIIIVIIIMKIRTTTNEDVKCTCTHAIRVFE
jgi:hypothetical protein